MCVLNILFKYLVGDLGTIMMPIRFIMCGYWSSISPVVGWIRVW